MEPHFFGKMDTICKHCKPKHFAAEKIQDSKFSSCWHKGKINLPPMTPPYVKNTADSKNVKENIKQYNNAVDFTSM